MNVQIELRKASEEDPESPDSRLIWEWRNDPVTRQMSRNSDPLPWESHKDWYARAARDPKKVLLMAEKEDGPFGMIRFDYIEIDRAEISINTKPGVRGQGLGRPLLISACDYGFNRLGLGSIYAEIKQQNAPSIKIFESAGFVFLGINESNNMYKYELTKEGFKHETA